MSTAIPFRNSEVEASIGNGSLSAAGWHFTGYSGAPFSTGLQSAAADRMREIGVGGNHSPQVATQCGNDPPYHMAKDLPEIQELFRHKNLSITVHNTHVRDEQPRQTPRCLAARFGAATAKCRASVINRVNP